MPSIVIALLAAFAGTGCGGSGGGGDTPILGPGGGSTALAADFVPDASSPGSNSVAMSSAFLSGDTLTLALTVRGVDNVASAALDVTFDPSMVELTGWAGGNAFPSCQPSGTTLCLVTVQPGRVVAGLALTGNGDGGVDIPGSANLMMLTFRAIRPGSSQLSFANAALQAPGVVDIPGTTWHGGTLLAN